jgi:hypothetical protein
MQPEKPQPNCSGAATPSPTAYHSGSRKTSRPSAPEPEPRTSPENQPERDDRAARLDELLARADQAAQRIASQQAERHASSQYAARIELEAQTQAGRQAEARDEFELELLSSGLGALPNQPVDQALRAAPCRSWSMSSMEACLAAAMAAARQATLRPAFAHWSPAGRTSVAARPCSPARSVSVASGPGRALTQIPRAEPADAPAGAAVGELPPRRRE